MNLESALIRLDASARVQIHRYTFLENRGASGAVLIYGPFGRMPATEIIHYQPDGSVTLNSGGFQTMGMKHRMNSFLPAGLGWSVYATRGKWYLTHPTKQPVPFVDGMRINADESVVSRTRLASKCRGS
jgi:hypothetical protein